MTTQSKSPRRFTKAELTTAALIVSGSVLAVTGVTMLASHWGIPVLAKAWKAIGVSDKVLGTAHQVSAVGFLAAAGVHIRTKQPTIGRHLKKVSSAVLPGEKNEEPSPTTSPT